MPGGLVLVFSWLFFGHSCLTLVVLRMASALSGRSRVSLCGDAYLSPRLSRDDHDIMHEAAVTAGEFEHAMGLFFPSFSVFALSVLAHYFRES